MSSVGTGFDHPAVEAVGAMHAALDALTDAALWSLPIAQLGGLVIAVEQAARRLDAARVALAAQADVAGVAEHDGATSLPAWLRAVADVPIGVTRARLSLHRELVNRPVVAAAFAIGAISMDAATAVGAAMSTLPSAVPYALTAEVEGLLVEVAREEGTQAVVQRAAEIVHRFAPEELENREQVQREKNALTLTRHHDGTLGIRGQLDPERGAFALAVLGAHASPHPAADGTPDFRDAPCRYADALIRVLELASASGPDVRGARPHVNVTISLDALQQRLGAAPGLLDSGAVISAAAARRLACDANLIPIVLGTNSEPLDIGRATRSWPTSIRRAIETRDHGCTMPACDRPAAWCDVHHLTYWSDGGVTAVTNGTLLCGAHHEFVHHQGWTIRMMNGVPWFTPPRWIDATQTPRLHSRFKTRDLDP